MGLAWEHAEQRPFVLLTSVCRRAVEIAIAGLDQFSGKVSVEPGHGRKCAVRSDPENQRIDCGAIEVSIGGFDQSPYGMLAVGPVKGYHSREGAVRSDLEHCTEAVRTPVIGGAIEIPVPCLNEGALRAAAIRTAGERIQ